MSSNPKTVEGIYRDGKAELLETPADVDEARVIVTFLPDGTVNLTERGIDETQAVSLRARLHTFAEDCERPEMGAYDAFRRGDVVLVLFPDSNLRTAKRRQTYSILAMNQVVWIFSPYVS